METEYKRERERERMERGERGEHKNELTYTVSDQYKKKFGLHLCCLID